LNEVSKQQFMFITQSRGLGKQKRSRGTRIILGRAQIGFPESCGGGGGVGVGGGGVGGFVAFFAAHVILYS